MTQVAVLICGAGPVGLVAGLRLARAGIETLVIDKASTVSDDFRASTFHPPTLEMLDELGLTQDGQQLGQQGGGGTVGIARR